MGCNNKVWTESSRLRTIRPLVVVYFRILYSWMKTVMYCFVYLGCHKISMVHS